jgi:hypothetical protein
MAPPSDAIDNGSWPHAQELFAAGDPAFLAEIRRITDADRLGEFAPRWYANPLPVSRELLLGYLDLPLNAFRHEALVKRLFKLAERAGDDEVMGRFLVLFDRSVRRVKKERRFHASEPVRGNEEAEALALQWRQQGYVVWFGTNELRFLTEMRELIGTDQVIRVMRSWVAEVLTVPPNQTIWRPQGRNAHGPWPIPESDRQRSERGRLFSVATRRYLQRRAWRYFRKLGKQHPERYVPAVTAALRCYRDEDVATGLALLDNWGLVHTLFHHSAVLRPRNNGWTLAPGRKLSALAPAPAYEALWKASPRALLDLLKARCRTVRQWAVHLIRREHAAILQGLTPDELFDLLAQPDAAVATLAVQVLRDLPDVAVLGVERLLGLVETPNPETLEILCGFLAARLGADRVTLEQAVGLAASRPLPAAWLGLTWLQKKTLASAADCQVVLRLTEAQAEPLRPEIGRWVRDVLAASPHFQADWVLEFLDSRHADVRAEGWQWLQADERVRDDVTVWRKLLESPYDDVRLLLVAALEERVGRRGPAVEADRLDEELLRFLWASVLLNIHRGGKSKPVVVRQLSRRLERQPEEAPTLLPILAVALRSVRGPEWRAGLAAVVQVSERRPELRPLVRALFPELKTE